MGIGAGVRELGRQLDPNRINLMIQNQAAEAKKDREFEGYYKDYTELERRASGNDENFKKLYTAFKKQNPMFNPQNLPEYKVGRNKFRAIDNNNVNIQKLEGLGEIGPKYASYLNGLNLENPAAAQAEVLTYMKGIEARRKGKDDTQQLLDATGGNTEQTQNLMENAGPLGVGLARAQAVKETAANLSEEEQFKDLQSTISRIKDPKAKAFLESMAAEGGPDQVAALQSMYSNKAMTDQSIFDAETASNKNFVESMSSLKTAMETEGFTTEEMAGINAQLAEGTPAGGLRAEQMFNAVARTKTAEQQRVLKEKKANFDLAKEVQSSYKAMLETDGMAPYVTKFIGKLIEDGNFKKASPVINSAIAVFGSTQQQAFSQSEMGRHKAVISAMKSKALNDTVRAMANAGTERERSRIRQASGFSPSELRQELSLYEEYANNIKLAGGSSKSAGADSAASVSASAVALWVRDAIDQGVFSDSKTKDQQTKELFGIARKALDLPEDGKLSDADKKLMTVFVDNARRAQAAQSEADSTERSRTNFHLSEILTDFKGSNQVLKHDVFSAKNGGVMAFTDPYSRKGSILDKTGVQNVTIREGANEDEILVGSDGFFVDRDGITYGVDGDDNLVKVPERSRIEHNAKVPSGSTHAKELEIVNSGFKNLVQYATHATTSGTLQPQMAQNMREVHREILIANKEIKAAVEDLRLRSGVEESPAPETGTGEFSLRSSDFGSRIPENQFIPEITGLLGAHKTKLQNLMAKVARTMVFPDKPEIEAPIARESAR